MIDTLNEAEFDLNNLVPQETTITSKNGDDITIGIEPIQLENNERMTQNLSDGKWKIYFYGIVLNAQFYIDIKNSKIIRAYDASYVTIGASCTYDKLTYTSTQATYNMKFNTSIGDFTIASTSGWLRAEIVGNKLITSIR